MYFVNSRKRNSDWVVTDDENANDDDDDDFDDEDDYKEDTEFNLNLADGKGFTVYDKRDVMVAVATGNNQAPVEMGSSKKPLLFPMKHNVKRFKVYPEETRDADSSDMNKSGRISILDEFYQESENTSTTVDSDETINEIQEVEEVDEVPEATEVTEITDLAEEVPEVQEVNEVIEVIEVNEMDELDEIDDATDIKGSVNGKICEDEIPGCSQNGLNLDMSDFPVFEEEVECYKPLPKIVNKESAISKLGLEFYKTKNENSYVLHIPCLANFTFYGKLRFTLITGKIEVFGYVVDIESKNKTIDVYCPRRFMQIGIKSVLPFSIPDYSDIEAALKNKAMLPEGELGNVMCNFSPDDTLVLVEKLPSNFSPILHHYFDEVDIFFEKHVLREGSPLEKDLDCLFAFKPKIYKIKTFTEGCEWKQIKIKRCNVVCGGKGVGKSTLIKYLINRTISNRDRVLCFDLDPGQTEFTPPGFVSAVLVRKPLLGPGFTHLAKPRKMAYVGTTNVSLDPVKYMKSVNYILQSCKHDPYLADIPWFINTMGFNKDIGLDIMINIIKLFRPDVVVQINSSEKSRNYMICLTANVVEIQPTISLVPVEDEVLYHDLIKTESSARMRELAIQSGFKPSQMRDLMTLSYFSPLLTFPYYSFNAVKPRWIRLSDVYLAANEAIPPRCILKAFNGSLVGLCDLDGISCTERLVIGNAEEVFCKVAIKPEVAPCFGLGLVRAIDVVEKKIYVITHLPDRELIKVNCLNMGNINPPPSVFLKQTYVDEPTIYTDVYDIGNNQKIKRVFNYVPYFNTA